MPEDMLDDVEMNGVKNLVNLASGGDLDPATKYAFCDYNVPAFIKVIPLLKKDVCNYCGEEISSGEGMNFSLMIVKKINLVSPLISATTRRKDYSFHYSHFRLEE